MSRHDRLPPRGAHLWGAHALLQRALITALSIMTIIALTLGALTFVPALWGMSTYAVRSPSMEPQIPLGSLVIVDANVEGHQVRPGDVVAFQIGGTDESVCVHRAKSIDQEGGLIETKGDANESPDLRLIPFEEVTGTVCAQIPLAGHLLIWTEANRMAFVATAAALALASASLSLIPADRHMTRQRKGTECQNKRTHRAEQA